MDLWLSYPSTFERSQSLAAAYYKGSWMSGSSSEATSIQLRQWTVDRRRLFFVVDSNSVLTAIISRVTGTVHVRRIYAYSLVYAARRLSFSPHSGLGHSQCVAMNGMYAGDTAALQAQRFDCMVLLM